MTARRGPRGRRTEDFAQGGFTLIEIMVVVIVLAIMASLVVPQFVGVTFDAKVAKAKTDIAEIQNALERFSVSMDRYPTQDEGLRALVEEPGQEAQNWRGPYLRELPQDPWGAEYQYRTPGQYGSKTYDLWSFGADGAEGGEEQAADITSWRQDEDK